MQRRVTGSPAKNQAKTEDAALGAKYSSSADDADRADNRPVPEASKLAPGLYVVATPIGNIQDVTHRALSVLGSADLIAAEDTRRTAQLLARHNIGTRLTPYHDHNARAARPRLLQRMRGGDAIALVSDAGTPLISDPGYKLVDAALKDGLGVYAVPGPSAILAALSVAGLPTDRFLFLGFLPSREAARRRTLNEAGVVEASLVVFETARRLRASLADMAAVLGPRLAAVCREMTKKFEEVRRGTLAELAAHYAAAGAPKGEIVVVVGPPDAEVLQAERSDAAADAAESLLRDALASMGPGRAASKVAALTGVRRNELYARALELTKKAKIKE